MNTQKINVVSITSIRHIKLDREASKIRFDAYYLTMQIQYKIGNYINPMDKNDMVC